MRSNASEGKIVYRVDAKHGMGGVDSSALTVFFERINYASTMKKQVWEVSIRSS